MLVSQSDEEYSKMYLKVLNDERQRTYEFSHRASCT